MTASAPIEDFLEAITAQLDRTQDALRLKAVNRPLTFALKDFNIDLSVFVEMDNDGRVKLRPSAPNESGASTIHISFTTITRPMIEENTISMEQTQSPLLEEAGLAPEESQRLERLGVRNMAQLRRLQEQSDEESVARFSGIDPGRLRRALKVAGPRINFVDIGPGRRTEATRQPDAAPPTVNVPPGQQRLRLRGNGLVEQGRKSNVRLSGKMLPIRAISQSHIEIELPEILEAGPLEIELPDGSCDCFSLVPEEGLIPGQDRWSSDYSDEALQ